MPRRWRERCSSVLGSARQDFLRNYRSGFSLADPKISRKHISHRIDNGAVTAVFSITTAMQRSASLFSAPQIPHRSRFSPDRAKQNWPDTLAERKKRFAILGIGVLAN